MPTDLIGKKKIHSLLNFNDEYETELYLKTRFVPHSKHTPSRMQEKNQITLCKELETNYIKHLENAQCEDEVLRDLN